MIDNLDKRNTLNINCDVHPEKMVKKYCKVSKKMLCNICSTNCDISTKHYQDKLLGANEFLDLIIQINKYLGPEKCQEDQILFNLESQQNSQKFENLQFIQSLNLNQNTDDKKEQEIHQLMSEKDKIKCFRGLVDYHLESLKYQQNNGFYKLIPLTGQSKLLYKASKDGFTAESFHHKCDNQGPTISFIQSEHGKVFGCYTSLSWATPDKHSKDSEAFVFSLSHNTLHEQYQNFDSAVGQYKKYFMVFGSSNDICIYDDCNSKNDNFCFLGGTYSPQQGFKLGDQQVREHLAGSEKFKVIEIEVYQVLL
ncbi:UNKNOWN [Stylonychia lemnae]|uniref:TLDc domain-containing protein n=1 Tax=Stylonychia lemnae TaxID=5949 RepID=A0A078B7Z5_STYLE|nr:UNKNOWN [Stylonychia lemnae]|eukprot:CDW89683.1 UNKNOWN [Stylonychia lemnae]